MVKITLYSPAGTGIVYPQKNLAAGKIIYSRDYIVRRFGPLGRETAARKSGVNHHQQR